ncbi:MAG: malto-oligosyltrehalose trehalohydrolase, partial [Elusimicrobia bacterium]|nr:malto-oligosyltrehalose trehalohydrolase [Elusimicrobiota bacterium]
MSAPRPNAAAEPGAHPLGGGRCRFRVWAPEQRKLALRLESGSRRRLAMRPEPAGWWSAVTEAGAGTLYRYILDGGRARPDPASLAQPQGVHGPAQIVDHAAFRWNDGGWRGRALEDLVVYELHVGTFTGPGTFDAVIPRLGELAELGVNAVEIMPVAQFPGERNWG